MACVKADGYGHGLVTVAETLREQVDAYAVACINEALCLREAAIDLPVLLLEGPHTKSEIDEAAARGLTLCISAPHQLDWLEATGPRGRPACWLKIDTGMHRLGLSPADVANASERLRNLELPAPVVLCTHFAAADDPDNPLTTQQLERFDEATGDEAVASTDLPQSCANSAAVFDRPDAHRDWVRPGYMLYGGNPFAARDRASLDLRAAMEFSAEIISVRDVAEGAGVGYGSRWRATRPSRIATVAAGYGDGYPRHAPDGTPVRIGSRCCPLAGRVSMDMITVDVTDHPGAVVGARAVLWGENPGVDDVARAAGTIGYELLAGMPSRVPRRIVDERAPVRR